MKIMSMRQLHKLEQQILNHEQTKEINNELAEEYMMVDLYSGFPPTKGDTNDSEKNE